MATQIGVITAVVGTVTATAEDGSIRTLQAGDRVYANEVISTGPAGAIEIEFADGSVMDLGRDSQAMLDSAVFNPNATEFAESEVDDVPDDVAAIQQAILEGEDPTEAGEATAAGAGVEGSDGGHDAVFVNYLNPEVTPDAGFETIGVNSTVDDIEDEQLIDGVPTAGLVTVLLDEDDLLNLDPEEAESAAQSFIDGISSEFLSSTGLSLGRGDSNGVGDDSLGDDLASPAPTFLTGALNADFGFNGPGSISFNPVVSQPTGLTSGGEPVQIWISADGLTLIGYIAGEGESESLEDAEIIFSAQINPASLEFAAGIYGSLDHPDTVEEGSFEENLLLNMVFTITDSDGDAAQGILQLNVDDDSPVIVDQAPSFPEQNIPREQFQEDEGQFEAPNPANADEDDSPAGVGNFDSPGDNGVTNISLPINFGADGPAEVNPVEITGITGDTLTSDGQPVVFAWNSETNTYEGTVDGQGVINIHVEVFDNAPDGVPGTVNGVLTQVSVEILDNLDHPVGSDGQILGFEDNLNINVDYIASDADGDQVAGSFELSIDDDMPVIGTPEAVSLDEEGLPNGNAGDSYPGEASGGVFENTNDIRIPASGDQGQVTSSIEVSGLDTIDDVNILLNLDHSWTGDLDIFLISPEGTRVELTSDNGGAANNYNNTEFDDEATDSITSGSAPFTGVFRPEGSLADFDGENPNGTWTLEINDDTFWDTGTLFNWHIEFNNGETSFVSDDLPGEETSATGSLDIDWGADNNNDAESGYDRSVVFSDQSAPEGLTADGQPVTYTISEDGTMLTAFTGEQGTDNYTEVFTVSLSDAGNGSYTFTLLGNLDHPEANTEDDINLSFDFIATDSDADSATGSFNVTVDDDAPVVSPYDVNTMRIISDDETVAELNGNIGEGFGTSDGAGTDSKEYNQSKTLQFSAGADGGTVAWNAENSSVDDDTAGISFSVNDDGSLVLTQEQNGEPVEIAVITLDESTGDYTYTQTGNVLHTEGDNENEAAFTLGFTVTDGDGDTADGYLTLLIDDDTPTVTPYEVNTMRIISDDDSVAGLNGNPGGVGDSNQYNLNGTLQFSAGADGGTVAWNVANSSSDGGAADVTFSVDSDGSLILTQMQNGEAVQVAKAILDENTGDYSYTQTANLLHTPGGDENNANFTLGFTVTDGDGDTADGHLVLRIDDDTPTVEPYEVNTMRIISDDDTVAGLNGNPGEGTNTNDGAGTDSKEYNQSKTLQFSTGADGGTVAWNVDNSSVDDATAGISFSVNGDGSLIITQMQNGVAVQVAEITLDANTGEYNYTQTSNLLHTAGDNENEAAFTLGFTVTDGDGDTADGHLTLLIDDDTPVITSQQINLLTESFEDFAPDLSGNNWTVVGEDGGTIIGNNGIEWTVNGAGIEIQSGNVGGVNEIPDGEVYAELDAHDSNNNGGSTLTQLSTEVDLPTPEANLSFDFQPRPSDVDGSDMTVSLGGQEVTINVDGSGVIDFGTLPSGVSASQSSSAGGWTTITLNFTGLDTSTAQTLSFEGQGSANTLGAYIDNISLNAAANLTVDESALADGNGEASASTTAVYDFSVFFTDEFGADGPAGEDSENYTLKLNGENVASGLFAVDNTDTDANDGNGFGQGSPIVLNEVDGDIVGSAGGLNYFTISVNAQTGEVTLTQYENIWHADTRNHDDSQSMVLDAELLTLVKTITDADQDSAEATLDLGGVNFNFEDDAPSIFAQESTELYQFTITNEGGDAGYNNTYGYYTKGDNGEPVSGEVIWANVKENTSDEISLALTDSSDIGFFIIPDGADLNDLNNGDAVTFEQDGEGNWQVLLGGEPLTGQGTNVLFDNANLNPQTAEAVENNAAAGNQNWEDIIGGDNDFNDVNINVSISQLSGITVDETDIGNGDPSNATTTVDMSGTFTADFGADGAGDVEYGLSVDPDVNTGLIDTQSGEEVLLRVVDGEVEGYINDGSDQVVFTVTVNSDGDVTLTQLRAVEHDDVTDPDEADSPATINAGAIALTGNITDADGDTASDSIDLGVTFAFEDDGPVAVSDTNSVEKGAAEGNVVTPKGTESGPGEDNYGADGAGSVTSVSFGDTTVNVPDNGPVEIEGDYGTLTMYSNGHYTYTTNPDSLPQNTQTVDGWENTGSNMTAFILGESFLTADGKFNDNGSGTVTTGGNVLGFGVAGTSGANTSVPEQINYSGSKSEALAFKFDGTVTSATVQFSNMFQNENGGEAMRWHAFDAGGNRIGSGIVSDNENASDPYANSTDATFSNNNIGSFTLSDIGAFTTLVFEGVPYSDDGSAGSDDSDFFVNVTSYEMFNSQDNAYQDEFGYTIVDGDGDSASATLTLNGNSEPQEGQLEPVAPVAADNTYQVDGVTSGNIITDDDDNGGAASGRDYDNDTPVINLSINSIIVNGDETITTEDGTEIELDNGTLVINLDGSYTYTPAQDADGGDEFEYTLVDPDGEVSEPATVTLLQPLVSDVVTLSDVTVNEGDGTAIITGSVENPVTGSPLVITLNNGAATITIDVGETTGTSTPFSIQGDDPYVDAETITVNVTGTSGGEFSSLDTSDTGTIIVEDTIDTTSVALTAAPNFNEDGTSLTYTLTLGNEVRSGDEAVTVNFTDLLGNAQSITINSGDTGTVNVTIPESSFEDVYAEADADLTVATNVTVSGGSDFESLDTPSVGTVELSDTIDTVTATLTTSTTEVNEDGGDIIYTITLSGGPGDIDPDTDLVFNLANGEQVTISAGDTSGSFTRTYTDAEITNQVSITNSIAGIVSGGSEYEDLQTAGTTTVDVDYAPEISNLTPAADGGDVTVDEDDLAEGSDTSKESTIQEGTFTISSGDAIDDLTIEGNAIITDGTFSATSFTTALGNTLSVTGYDDNTGEITYTYELADNTLIHGPANNGENGVFENLAVSLSDVDGDVANDTLSVQIIDDTPTASPAEASGIATQQVNTNLMLILDVSGSMDDDANFQGMSRLEVMIKSSLELLDQYDAYGDVMVNLVTFSWSGANPTNGWVSVDDAKTILLGLEADGNTNYDDALNDAINAFGQSGSIPGAQNVSYFMSDGVPNENYVTNSATIPGSDNDLGGGDGISSSEEADWIRFLEFYNIKSYALGMGTGVNEANLNPIAYDGVAEANLDSIVVTNFAELQTTLVGTIEVPPLTGTLLNGGLPASAGADGGYIQSITVDGVTYSFNQQTDTSGTSGGSAGSFDTSTNTWTITTASGAELSVDMDTGEYYYAGPDGLTSVLNETFGYVVVDNDGDAANSTLEVTIDPAEGPTVVRDDFVLTNQDPTDIPDWALLANDTGPNSDSQQLTGVSNANSGNVTDNSDNTVTFDDTGSDDGSFSYTNNAGGQSENGNVYVNQVSGDEIEGSYLDEILVGSDNQSDTLDGNAGNDILIGGDGVTGGPVARQVNADVRAGDTYSSNNNQFGFNFAVGAGLSITQIRINMGNKGDFDPGDKFGIGDQSDISNSDVDYNNSYVSSNNGTLVLSFNQNAFTAGETLRFGIDTDDDNRDLDDGEDFGEENVNFTITFSDGMTISGTYDEASGDTSFASVTDADAIDSGMQIDDELIGGAGDDILVGGGGNDLLTGGDGADTFKWESGDEGTAASPAMDFVTDFDSSEGDVLDLADILQGEESNDITNYISVAQDGDDVVINVTPDGAGGDMNQVITLQDTTVDQLAGGIDTSGMSQADIINTLITNGQLNVDQS